MHGSLGVIFMGNRSAENGEYAVAQELVDHSLVALNLPMHQIETVLHEVLCFFRIDRLDERKIHAENGHLFALASELASGSATGPPASLARAIAG